jgi:tRNA-specific 2-thiouridylase
MRIAVAMSGGVDSSTAAAILSEQGHEVVGLTLKIWENSRCCSLADAEDARRSAARLGIPFFVVDAREVFEAEVVEPFVEAYSRGFTPNPCLLCNRRVKFRWLRERARALGCEALATGHYARLHEESGRRSLLRGADRKKDQSYFLVPEDPADLDPLVFPLGELTKPEVRRRAASRLLSVASKRESQDVCFVPPGGLAWFLQGRLGPAESGEIVDPGGRVLGTHRGLHAFTVGQRRGLGIAFGEPFYVLRKEVSSNRLVVGTRRALDALGLMAAGAVWLTRSGAPALECEVQIRSTAQPVPCRVQMVGDRLRVRFAEPQFAVAPGQIAVFYDGDRVLGGAWIEEQGERDV